MLNKETIAEISNKCDIGDKLTSLTFIYRC